MIITVTLNTGIDRTYLLSGFHWNQTLRASTTAVGMGGKAIDASWVLGELGIENLALGLAAGAVGKHMEQMLQERGVKTQFTWVEGESRTNIILVSRSGEGQSTITGTGLIVGSQHLADFQAIYQASLPGADCVILGGSVPSNVEPQLYTELVQWARARNVPVVFDAGGAELAAGLAGRPTLVKPNQAELEDLIRRPVHTLQDVYHAARELHAQYGCGVVATLGAQGALAVTHDQALFIEPPAVEVKSAAGAGDAILAGLAQGLAQHWPLEAGLRLGFAAAAAVLMTLPTADCRREEVERLLPLVQIRNYRALPLPEETPG